MTYSAELIDRFHRELPTAIRGLHSLLFRGITEAQNPPNDHVRRFLQHGVGRRLTILQHSIEEIFAIFPPEREASLTHDEAVSLQIHLHAFLINLAGVFDNWAWAFVYRHGLRDRLQPQQIGIFKPNTQRYLPQLLLDYLTEKDTSDWHSEYAKEYRDALAHRIAPYVPPAGLTDDEVVRHRELQELRNTAVTEFDFEAEEEARNQQLRLGKASPYFVHDISPDEEGIWVVLHGQLLCDILTVIEFGNVFYDSWGDRAN